MYYILLYNVKNIYIISMEVLLPSYEIIEGLYFLANAAKDRGVLFFFIRGIFGFIGNQRWWWFIN